MSDAGELPNLFEKASNFSLRNFALSFSASFKSDMSLSSLGSQMISVSIASEEGICKGSFLIILLPDDFSPKINLPASIQSLLSMLSSSSILACLLSNASVLNISFLNACSFRRFTIARLSNLAFNSSLVSPTRIFSSRSGLYLGGLFLGSATVWKEPLIGRCPDTELNQYNSVYAYIVINLYRFTYDTEQQFTILRSSL